MTAAREPVTAKLKRADNRRHNPSGLAITVERAILHGPETFKIWVARDQYCNRRRHLRRMGRLERITLGKLERRRGDFRIASRRRRLATTYTANFNTQYLLTLAAAPSGGGTLTANSDRVEAMATMPAEHRVQVTAAANSGFQFAGFSGDSDRLNEFRNPSP